jgi:histidine ammonia-lyase
MISLGPSALSLDDFSDIVFKQKKISLSASALQEIDTNFHFLQEFSSDKLIYGINTGFGPMAQYKVKEEDLLSLQYNLIRSHSSGCGNLLPPLLVKALMIARLNSLMQAYSGVHRDVVELLVILINQDITPCIYEHGGVGASGDLVQLAHLALVLIGEGEVMYENKIQSTGAVYKQLGIKPLSVHVREGLAILNGTSAMTGIGMVNLIQARKLLEWSAILSAMTNEIVEAFDDHFSYELNIVKHHIGQNRIAEMFRAILKDSKMIRKRSDHLYHAGKIGHDVFEDKVQEYYSLRCVSQVLGPVYDTIAQAEKILTDELNSVNDNPVIDHRNKNVFHGGNFHGDYVSLEMDKLYVHSIPNNNDNQDIVSMGCNAAIMTKKVIGNSFEVLSIQLMSILQAIDHLGCHEKLAPHTLALYTAARNIFPKFIEDAPKYKDLEKISLFLQNTDPKVSSKTSAA